MRSNDVINLLPYDVFHHTSLQIFLASILGLELGHYHHTCAQYYWPKKRELRNYGPTLLAKLQDSKPPENTHFPWVEPRKSIAQASRAVRQYVRLSTRGTSIDEDLSIPDPYIQSLVDFVTKGKTHETD